MFFVGDQSSSFQGDQQSTTKERFAPLEMTTKIHRKISKFGAQAPIVEKTLSSFGHFYQAANKLDDNLIQKHGPQVASQVELVLLDEFSSYSFSFRRRLCQIPLNLF